MLNRLKLSSLLLSFAVATTLVSCTNNNTSGNAINTSSHRTLENISNISLGVDKDSYIDPAQLEKFWVDPSKFIDTSKYDPTIDQPKEGSPNAPSDLVIELADESIMKLSWMDNSKDESYFEIMRATDPQFEKNVEVFKAEANDSESAFFVDKIPSLEANYFYQVRAVNDAGSSNPVARRAPVTWLDNGHNGTVGIFSLFCRSVPVASIVTSGIGQDTITISWAPSPGGFSGAISYNYTYRVHNTGAFLPLASSATNSVTLTGLQAGASYDFMVQSHCSSSNSGFTPLVFATLPPPCDVPANLAATVVTDSSATLNWDAVAGAVNYNYQYRKIGDPWTTASASTISQAISGLASSSNYEFQVQAVCASNSSAFSASANFTTLVAPCNQPTGLSATAISNTNATLNWSAVAGAVSYNAQYRKIGDAWTNATSATNSLVISTLIPVSNYEFKVETVCAINTSGFTSSGTFITGGVPRFNKIVVVIGENTNASAVFGSSYAPYINALAASGLKFTDSYAITHPSQPNYLELYSGSNQGVIDDAAITNSPYITANLGRELIDAGKTYATYSEDLPSVGYNGGSAGGTQGYVRRHNPAANWMGSGTNQIPTTTNQPFTAFPTNFSNLPSVSFVVPNICNDGHDDCLLPADPVNNETKQFDDWVAAHLDAYKQWAINNNSLLIVTYDEDDFTAVNKISTVMFGAHMQVGAYNQTINHHDVLRTIEDAMGLTTHAGAAATASPIDFTWTP